MEVIDDRELPRRIPWRVFMDGRTYRVNTMDEYQKSPRQFAVGLSTWARRHDCSSTWDINGELITFRMEPLPEVEKRAREHTS